MGYIFFTNPVVGPPPNSPPTVVKMGLMTRPAFSNNSLVYYRIHSLSQTSGGNGVRNSRYIGRRT